MEAVVWIKWTMMLTHVWLPASVFVCVRERLIDWSVEEIWFNLHEHFLSWKSKSLHKQLMYKFVVMFAFCFFYLITCAAQVNKSSTQMKTFLFVFNEEKLYLYWIAVKSLPFVSQVADQHSHTFYVSFYPSCEIWAGSQSALFVSEPHQDLMGF